MSARLIARTETGEILYDTTKISYGLVKSGYLSYVENWRQLRLRGINVNPNIGSSWVDQGVPGINQYGFTVENPRSPIVFLVGKGIETGVKVSGNSKTYLYAGASEETKFYCFDLMVDDEVGGPGLKSRSEDGVLTFNSRQPVLNVIAAITAPEPGTPNRFGRPVTTYVGGRNERISFQSVSGCASIHSVVDIPFPDSSEYAAFLPWNRSCGVIDPYAYNTAGGDIYGVAEGAYGRTGGISFFFGSPGKTTMDQWPGRDGETCYYLMPTDRYPTALVIKTAGLPFPFN